MFDRSIHYKNWDTYGIGLETYFLTGFCGSRVPLRGDVGLSDPGVLTGSVGYRYLIISVSYYISRGGTHKMEFIATRKLVLLAIFLPLIVLTFEARILETCTYPLVGRSLTGGRRRGRITNRGLVKG